MVRFSVPLLLTGALSLTESRGGDAAALWSRNVRPLFDIQCVKCHGPIEQKSGLELDTPDAVFKGGDEGPVVVPGKPDESRLYKYLAADADPHMPPKKQLTDTERAAVHEWISALGTAPAPQTPAPATSIHFASITEAVDQSLAAGWSERGLTPAAPLEDAAWCRRIYLDLAGRIPTEAETLEFLTSSAPDRRAALADRLLASDEYPIRMRELWDAILMGRGKRERSEDRRRDNGWWTFLENAFRTNRPWNQTVHDVLTGRPDNEENRGASWFLYERRNEHQQIAEAVAPIVYGTRIDCAQCHDHPLAREIKQGHYWGLVAAYNRSKNVEGGNLVAESATGGFINFTNLKKESQPAVITLLTGVTISESPTDGKQKDEDTPDKYVDPSAKARVPKFSRREAFADAATHDNPLLARALVNRMWAVLFGRGIVHPADEMNARNAPSHPALLDWLSRDFAGHGYDVRRLLRGLVLSRAYALGSSEAAAPPDAFTAAPERPLTGEQIARSWSVAAGNPSTPDSLRRAAIAALPDVMPLEYNATFQQAQFLTNSPALAALLTDSPAVARVAALPDAISRTRAVFRAALGRDPDAVETQRAAAFLNDRPDQPAPAVRDLLWAVLTGAEFLTAPR
jgi:hypothetical protein